MGDRSPPGERTPVHIPSAPNIDSTAMSPSHQTPTLLVPQSPLINSPLQGNSLPPSTPQAVKLPLMQRSTPVPWGKNTTPKGFQKGPASVESFKKELSGMGLKHVMVPGDGWCLFHAVAICLGRKDEGPLILKEVIEEMINNPGLYLDFMEDNMDIAQHVGILASKGDGGEPELRAISKLYGRPIEMWTPGPLGVPLVTKEYPKAKGSIKLAYYDGNHYNAILADADDTLAPQPNRSIPEVGSSTSGIPTNVEQQGSAGR